MQNSLSRETIFNQRIVFVRKQIQKEQALIKQKISNLQEQETPKSFTELLLSEKQEIELKSSKSGDLEKGEQNTTDTYNKRFSQCWLESKECLDFKNDKGAGKSVMQLRDKINSILQDPIDLWGNIQSQRTIGSYKRQLEKMKLQEFSKLEG